MIVTIISTIAAVFLCSIYHRLIARETETEIRLLRKRVEALKSDVTITGNLLSSLKAERQNLLETNLYMQRQIEFYKMQIKVLSPYQAIKSKMAWGKN